MFVSHDTGAVVNLCSMAVLLDKGNVTKIGTPKDVCELYLETLYDVPQVKVDTAKINKAKKETQELHPTTQASGFSYSSRKLTV